MKAYLARLNAQQERPHELVGIFVAATHEQLCDLVDECCDIDCVEVTEMGPGGIYWPRAVSYPMPYEGDIETMPDLPAGATLSELWLDLTRPNDEVVWQQLAWESEMA
jgi:hypothetical protein